MMSFFVFCDFAPTPIPYRNSSISVRIVGSDKIWYTIGANCTSKGTDTVYNNLLITLYAARYMILIYLKIYVMWHRTLHVRHETRHILWYPILKLLYRSKCEVCVKLIWTDLDWFSLWVCQFEIDSIDSILQLVTSWNKLLININ